jgi:sulfatase modifying factor 1
MKETTALENIVVPDTAPMVRIAGGSFLMGSESHYPEEAPVHQVEVTSFLIDRYPVTNAEFTKFVEETGYITWAERPARAEDYPGAKPEMLEPASVVFQKTAGPVDMNNVHNWWTYVRGANFRHPRGPESSIEGLAHHPVVHVGFEDAEAYAKWSGKELPTEAEWEFAARGGLEGATYSWGEEITPGGKQMANAWQGQFPYENLLEDGYEWTSPVGSFPPNGYGLYDMTGNVWEWTVDWYQEHSKMQKQSCCGALVNPRGGSRESSAAPGDRMRIARRVMKGGSYLCAWNYCRRYRPAARMGQPIDTATCHLGFRCIVRETAR